MTETILVLKIEVGRVPERVEIPRDLASMQSVVGGPIQAVYPFEEPVALVCHEEGKLEGLPLNRALRDEAGEIYDVIAGTFFLCGAPPEAEEFTSLTEAQLLRYERLFRCPEVFVSTENGLMYIGVIGTG